MARSNKSLFSPSDLFTLADSIVSMHVKYDLILKLAKAENNKEMIDAYGPIVFDLELLINAYGLKQLVKIN